MNTNYGLPGNKNAEQANAEYERLYWKKRTWWDSDLARSITGGGGFAITFIMVLLVIYMATCAGS